jgi:hypothetical protein
LQRISPREFPLQHSVRTPYGDFWSAIVPIASTSPEVPGSAWDRRSLCVSLHHRQPNVGLLTGHRSRARDPVLASFRFTLSTIICMERARTTRRRRRLSI